MAKIGGLIKRLSLPTDIYKPNVTKNELGGNIKSMIKSQTAQIYITSNENSGSRTQVVEQFQAIRSYVAQTVELNLDIEINDILQQNGIAYRVTEIDPNAANVAIEAEYKLQRIGDLQDEQL